MRELAGAVIKFSKPRMGYWRKNINSLALLVIIDIRN
jgi:hypothetical protein